MTAPDAGVTAPEAGVAAPLDGVTMHILLLPWRGGTKPAVTMVPNRIAPRRRYARGARQAVQQAGMCPLIARKVRQLGPRIEGVSSAHISRAEEAGASFDASYRLHRFRLTVASFGRHRR